MEHIKQSERIMRFTRFFGKCLEWNRRRMAFKAETIPGNWEWDPIKLILTDEDGEELASITIAANPKDSTEAGSPDLIRELELEYDLGDFMILLNK